MAHLISSILDKREIVFVHPDASVQDCVKLMADNGIGAVVVKDEEQQRILGIISERDITRKVVRMGLDPLHTSAQDIVHSEVTILDCHQPIEKAMAAITHTRRRHVLVKDGSDVISIVSIGDLMKHVLEEKSIIIEHLENYIYS
jgi:CBS domain-containing protein